MTTREDLWARVKAIQATPGFVCVEDRVACGEVQLVHAAHEAAQGGWRYATPYVRIAEDILLKAEAAAKRGVCLPPLGGEGRPRGSDTALWREGRLRLNVAIA